VCYVALLAYTAGLMIAYYATLAIGNNYEDALTKNSGQFNDFRAYLSLGRLAQTDKRYEIYDWKVQDAWFRKDMKAIPKNNGTNYINYAPYFFLVVIPLSILPAQVVLVAWYAVAIALASVALILLCKESGQLTSPIQKGLFLLGSFVNMPSVYGLAVGQLHWFQCGVLALYFLWLLRGKQILGGLSLVVVACKPHHALFISVPALADKRWKLLLCACVVGLLLLVAAGAHLGWDNVIKYPQVLAARASSQEMEAVFHTAPRSISIRALVSLLPWNLALALSSATMLLSIVFLFYIWKTAARASARSKHWAVALTVVLMLLAGPHSHIYDAVFLSIAAALTLPTVSLHQVTKLSPTSLRIWCMSFIFFPIVSLTYIMYYQIMYPDFVLFIVIEAIMAVTGFICFKQSLKDQVPATSKDPRGAPEDV
jgi:hypothetical protein